MQNQPKFIGVKDLILCVLLSLLVISAAVDGLLYLNNGKVISHRPLSDR